MGERVRYDESLYYRPSNGSEVRDYYDTFYFFKEVSDQLATPSCAVGSLEPTHVAICKY